MSFHPQSGWGGRQQVEVQPPGTLPMEVISGQPMHSIFFSRTEAGASRSSRAIGDKADLPAISNLVGGSHYLLVTCHAPT